jgi:hypothetical protein
VNTTLSNVAERLARLAELVDALPQDVVGWVQTIGDHQAAVHVDRDGDSPIDPDEAFDRVVRAFHDLHVGGDEHRDGDPGYTPGFRTWVAGASVHGWSLSVVVRSRA